jgi:hypothetical protein
MNPDLQHALTSADYFLRYWDLAFGFFFRDRKRPVPYRSPLSIDSFNKGYDGLARLKGSHACLHCRFEIQEKTKQDDNIILTGWMYVDRDCKPLGITARIFDFKLFVSTIDGATRGETQQLAFHQFTSDYSIPILTGYLSGDLDRLSLSGKSQPEGIEYLVKARHY